MCKGKKSKRGINILVKEVISLEEMLKQFEEKLHDIVYSAVETALSNYEVSTSSDVSDVSDRVEYLKTDFTEFLDKFGRVFRS